MEWKYEGSLPAIVDFYADWCQPCKMVAPVLEDLASEYAGKIMIYKVNTEEQQELASVFGIQSIPTLIFIPKEGQPQAAMGALSKQTFEKVIKDVLLKRLKILYRSQNELKKYFYERNNCKREFDREVLKGEKVIIDFYSTECPPCEAACFKI